MASGFRCPTHLFLWLILAMRPHAPRFRTMPLTVTLALLRDRSRAWRRELGELWASRSAFPGKHPRMRHAPEMAPLA